MIELEVELKGLSHNSLVVRLGAHIEKLERRYLRRAELTGKGTI